MKRLFILIAFIFIANITAYAFDNKYFSVSDKGFVVKKESDTSVSFIIPKDKSKTVLSGDDEYEIYINVYITETEDDEKEDKVYFYRDYDEGELKEWKEICNNLFLGDVKDFKEEKLQYLAENEKDSTEEEREAIVDKYINENNKIENIYLGNFGKYKAYIYDSIIDCEKRRVIKIVTLNRLYSIFIYGSDFFDTDESCKEFVKTIVLKDKEATRVNSFLYAYFWWFIIIPLAIIEIKFKYFNKKKSQ